MSFDGPYAVRAQLLERIEALEERITQLERANSVDTKLETELERITRQLYGSREEAHEFLGHLIEELYAEVFKQAQAPSPPPPAEASVHIDPYDTL